MRRFLTVLILLMPSLALAGTCGNGYASFIQVKLQKAVGGDQSNFVYSGVLNYSALKTVANGGHVQNTANNAMGVSGPADFIVCDASSAGNPLSFDVPFYGASTGIVELVFLQTTLHTATNDSVYIFFDNSGVVTSQQDAGLGTNSNFYSTAGFVEVCHEPNGSSLDVKCSLSAGTVVNHSAGATTGQIDGAASFVAASSQYIDLGAPISNATVTAEVWAKPTTLIGCQRFFSNLPTSAFNGFELFIGFSNAGACVANGQAAWQVGNAGNLYSVAFPNAIPAGGWHYFAASQTSTTVAIYQDGIVQAGTGIGTPRTIGTTSTNMRIGSISIGSPYFLDGAIDELRISNSVRSANWIATTYNTEAYPAFQVVGETFATPTIVNFGACSSNSISGTLTCPLNFPVSSGGYIVLLMADNGGVPCAGGSITDTLGLTYTNQVTASLISAPNGYSCILSAPITSAGADTITIPISNAVWAIAYEVKSITATGIATASTTSNQPTTISATAPSSNSFLACATIGALSVVPSAVTPSSDTFRGVQGSDPAFSYRYLGAATGVVASGSQSCAFDVGRGGTLAIFGAAAPTGTKRRPSQVY